MKRKAWQPNISTYPHIPGDKTLLWEAFKKFQPAKLLERLEDEEGVFALNTDKAVLVAKKEPYGFIVSAHARAVASADNQGKKLVMFLKCQEKFYAYDPKEIIKNSEPNKRGNATFLNWNIKLGTRVNVLWN